jgi:Anti-sigma-K factor rskA, C-terminal
VTPSAPASALALDRTDAVDAATAVPAVRTSVELPRARRPGWAGLASLALASGLVAIGLGSWAIVSGQRDGRRAGTPSLDARQLDTALAILADPAAGRQVLRGSVGRLVLVASERGAVLALDGLGAPPDGHAYEAWVVPPGSATPLPAGTFDGTERVVLLTQPVPPGARVGVTLEHAGGVDQPSRPLRLAVERAG